jgi:hypothetical protein
VPHPHLSPTATIALPWTAPSFAAVKGIIHAPGAKPTMKPESRMLSSPPSPRPQGMGRMTISGSAALPPSPRLSNGRPRANGTSVCSLPSPSCGPVSFRRSSMARRRRISRSPASPRRCPIPRPSQRIDPHAAEAEGTEMPRRRATRCAVSSRFAVISLAESLARSRMAAGAVSGVPLLKGGSGAYTM